MKNIIIDETLTTLKSLLYSKFNRADGYLAAAKARIIDSDAEAALLRIQRAIQLLIEARDQIESSSLSLWHQTYDSQNDMLT